MNPVKQSEKTPIILPPSSLWKLSTLKWERYEYVKPHPAGPEKDHQLGSEDLVAAATHEAGITIDIHAKGRGNGAHVVSKRETRD